MGDLQSCIKRSKESLQPPPPKVSNKSLFLQCPPEIREKVYITLFRDQIIDMSHYSSTKSGASRVNDAGEAEQKKHFSKTRKMRCYPLLLACKQTYSEGLVIFYQHATIYNYSRLNLQNLSNSASHPPFPSPRIMSQGGIAEWKGDRTRFSMIKHFSRHFVEEVELLQIQNYNLIQLMEELVILQVKQDPINLSTSIREEESPKKLLPTDEHVIRFANGVFLQMHREIRRGGTFFTDLAAMQKRVYSKSSLALFMDNFPTTRFISRVPVSYEIDGTTKHEICDLDLRTNELIRRNVVSAADIRANHFPTQPPPEPSYHLNASHVVDF